jgi:hypothetical protein
MVKNINPLAADSEPKDGFIVYNDELYFTADDGTSGRELWKTNGTDAGTVASKISTLELTMPFQQAL